jgi:hypothetical protein
MRKWIGMVRGRKKPCLLFVRLCAWGGGHGDSLDKDMVEKGAHAGGGRENNTLQAGRGGPI